MPIIRVPFLSSLTRAGSASIGNNKRRSMDLLLFAASAVAWRAHVVWSRSTSSSSSAPSTFGTRGAARKQEQTTPGQCLPFTLLQQQNAETSTSLIRYYDNNPAFLKLSKHEGELIQQRDREDDEKLQKGIEYAISKGVIDANFVPEPYTEIDVLGRTPDQVADVILQQVQETNNRTNAAAAAAATSSDAGSVIVLVGLSGTGKGTTVAKLHEKLVAQGKKVVTWSNGNIFRSVTLLAATWCQQQEDIPNGHFDAARALTKENVASFMNMLTFDKFKGAFDTRIHGFGMDYLVSQVQNTELKAPMVSKNIPTVAECTQGEVILFAARAIETMISHDSQLVVLLEGREQTVNYVRSPHRFNLVLSDGTLIGKRRAAQRIMADALRNLSAHTAGGTNTHAVNETMVAQALDEALHRMMADF